MNAKTAAIAAFLFVPLAPAHAQQTQTFDFTNKPNQQSLQEIATILRTVGDIRNLSINPAPASLTIQGTPDELAMSGWIVHQLDQPASPPPSTSAQFLVAGKSDDVIQVFHLAHIPTAPQAMQEILTVLRTVADIQKIFSYTPLTDLVVRGPAVQIALAQYLIGSFDVAPGSVTTSQEFPYVAPPPNHGPEVVRVFYLKNSPTPQAVQEILTILRVVAVIEKVFNYTPLTAMAVRGSASDLAAAEFLIQSLDMPSDAKAPAAGIHEFSIPTGGMIGVYSPVNIKVQNLSPTLTLVRQNLQIQKAFMKTAPPALIFRGTPDQITKAEQLIQQKDQP
jgi:uncharacterized MnhB-related membrane protein